MSTSSSKILLIETSTSLCSVALAENAVVTSYKESTEPRAQAALTAPFVDEVLKSRDMKLRECTAICVSSGPGSYTGLRVGVSTAKGLCFGASLPLVSIDTLSILAAQAFDEDLVPEGCKYIVPMIDARRMEVYTTVYRCAGSFEESERIAEITPMIVGDGSFADLLAEGKVLFIGDGALKCKDTLNHPNAVYAGCCPKASSMLRPALKKIYDMKFEDVAYFEPFYLKEFVATVSKKNLF